MHLSISWPSNEFLTFEQGLTGLADLSGLELAHNQR